MKKKYICTILILFFTLPVIFYDKSENIPFTNSENREQKPNNSELKIELNNWDWNVTWGKIDNNETGNKIAINTSGDIYVLGKFKETMSDLLLIKFNSTGDILWTVTWDSGFHDEPGGIDISDDGYIYVCGTISNLTSKDIVLIQFNETGGVIWDQTWDSGYDDYGIDLVIDSENNINIAGHLYNDSFEDITDKHHEIILLKYDNAGKLIYNTIWGDKKIFIIWIGDNIPVYVTKYFNERAYGIAVDSNDNLYIVGESYLFGWRSLLLKFNNSGVVQWNQTWYMGLASNGRDIIVDDYDYIYIVAESFDLIAYGIGNFVDLYYINLLKYNNSGGLEYSKTRSRGKKERIYEMALGPNNKMFITGKINSSKERGYEVLLLQFDNSGNLELNESWGYNGDDIGYGVAISSSNNVLITGVTDNFGEKDLILVNHQQNTDPNDNGNNPNNIVVNGGDSDKDIEKDNIIPGYDLLIISALAILIIVFLKFKIKIKKT